MPVPNRSSRIAGMLPWSMGSSIPTRIKAMQNLKRSRHTSARSRHTSARSRHTSARSRRQLDHVTRQLGHAQRGSE
eukprot:2051427-Rhodomonas_salina.7